jgi:hypothetical protein
MPKYPCSCTVPTLMQITASLCTAVVCCLYCVVLPGKRSAARSSLQRYTTKHYIDKCAWYCLHCLVLPGKRAEVGVRYSSSVFTAGVAQQALHQLCFVLPVVVCLLVLPCTALYCLVLPVGKRAEVGVRYSSLVFTAGAANTCQTFQQYHTSLLYSVLLLPANCTALYCLVLPGKRAEVGVRYSSPVFTAGAVLQPATNKLSHLWLCGRREGVTCERGEKKIDAVMWLHKE